MSARWARGGAREPSRGGMAWWATLRTWYWRAFLTKWHPRQSSQTTPSARKRRYRKTISAWMSNVCETSDLQWLPSRYQHMPS